MTKTLTGVLVFCFFTFSFFVTIVSAQSIAVVSEEFAEAYANPWHGAGIAAYFEEGDVIDIATYGDGWISFIYECETAYIPLDSVTVIQAEGLVCAKEAMLLREPTPFALVTASVPMGTVLSAIGYYGDYYAVDLYGESAYVYKNDMLGGLLGYLDVYGPTPYVINLDIGMGNYLLANTPMIDAHDEYLTVTGTNEGLNLRTYPSADAPVVVCIPNGNTLEVVDLGTEWHYVTYNGESGYVSAKFTAYTGDRLATVEFSEQIPLGAATADPGLGGQIVTYAKQFIGSKYKWGGTSASGFDCSGFVYSVYKSVGITLNRSSKDQIKNGTTVSKSELIPGDLVFFATTGGGKISHVGIYIGNGDFIHSSSSKKRGVVISSLSEDYYKKTYVNACRVIV